MRKTFFGLSYDSLSKQETLEQIDKFVSEKRFCQHSVINVAKVVSAQVDAELKESVNSCDIINIDGMGVLWGMRFLGEKSGERIAGVDLFFDLLTLAQERGYPVYFLGATQEVLNAVCEKASKDYPGLIVAGAHHGYFSSDETAVVNGIRSSGAKLLFVAISSPKKENFINAWRDALGVSFAMGVGGTFDVYAGKVSRAPLWMQNAGLEWFYRVLQEPGRMWKRYLITNTTFALMLIKARLGANY